MAIRRCFLLPRHSLVLFARFILSPPPLPPAMLSHSPSSITVYLSLSFRHLSTLKFLWRVQFPTWLIGIKADGLAVWSLFKAPDEQKARTKVGSLQRKGRNRAARAGDGNLAPTISTLP